MTIDYHDSPAGLPAAESQTKRSWFNAMQRGFFSACPNCGKKSIFSKFLKIKDSCDHCGEELHHHRADDAPPYFTIFIVGHIILPLILVVEKLYHPAVWVHLALWFPVTIILTFALLPRIKGSILGLQWALRMHGFEFSAVCKPHSVPNPKD